MKRLILFLIIVNILLRLGVYGETRMEFGIPINLGSTINSTSLDGGLCIEPNNLRAYFSSGRPGGFGSYDLWRITRATISDPWGTPENLGPTINSGYGEASPCISPDGLVLYFASNRPGYGNYDLWVMTRATTSSSWGAPVNLGPEVNSLYSEIFPTISSDGLELYFSDWGSARPGGCGDTDIWVARRVSINEPWGEPNQPGLMVNSPYYDSGPYISPDGLSLYFSSDRPGGYGREDAWVAGRAAAFEPWNVPKNLGPTVNTSSYDGLVCISPDGSVLYFGSTRYGGIGDWDIWQVPVSVLSVADLNEDGVVDLRDFAIFAEDWLSGRREHHYWPFDTVPDVCGDDPGSECAAGF